METITPNYYKYLRLRHLTAILGRNFQLLELGKQKENIFFALNLPQEDSIGYFYQSYSIPYNQNPTWEALDLSDCSTKYQASKSVVISWFLSRGKQHNRLIMEVELHFSGLYCLGLEIPQKLPSFAEPANLLIFLFGDRYYIPKVETQSIPMEQPSYSLGMEALPAKPSFSFPTLKRLFSVLKAKTDTRIAIRRLKDSAESELFRRRVENKITSDLDDKKASIVLLHDRIKSIRNRIETHEISLNRWKQRSQTIENDLKELRETREHGLKYGEEINQNIVLIKSDSQRLYQGIINRKTHMIHELVNIFPINPIDPSPIMEAEKSVLIPRKSSLQYTICNVPLPNCDIDGQVPKIDEKHLGASLGMVAHVVFLISLVCDVPLRYPVRLNGSRCRIMDNVVPNLPEKERDFPLYLKTTTNVRHKYGLYLMNLNIATLRGFFGMSTNNPRATLWNLKSLMEIRLRGKAQPVATGPASNNGDYDTQQDTDGSGQSSHGQHSFTSNLPTYQSSPNLVNNNHSQTSLQTIQS